LSLSKWGIAIPAAIFNNRFDQIAGSRIDDPQLVSLLIGGKSYEHATASFLDALAPETRRQLIDVFTDSLRRAWQVAIAFAAFGFLVTFLEKEIPLRNELETNEFGMETKEEKDQDKEKGVVLEGGEEGEKGALAPKVVSEKLVDS
jgi:hypothetical protein